MNERKIVMGGEKGPEVKASLRYIHEHLLDPLTLEEVADQAGYSPYHFARIFKEQIGIPLFSYVSILRIHRAKELLIHSDFTVRDIALEVGHQSLGTFTTRFTEKVGISPAAYRREMSGLDRELQILQRLRGEKRFGGPAWNHCSITGKVVTDRSYRGIILIGLFPKPVPEGVPLYSTLIMNPGDFCLEGIKPEVYYLMATSLPWETDSKDLLMNQNTLRTRLTEPLIVGPGGELSHRIVRIGLPQPGDLPILVSLPLLVKRFLQKSKISGKDELQ